MILTVKLIKILSYITFVIVFALCLAAIIGQEKLKLIREFQALKEVDPLVEARRLVVEGEYCEALEYLDYFLDYEYVNQKPEVMAFYDEIKKKRQSLGFIGTDVLTGVWKGKGACPESLVSATVSDFLIIGDVRDFVKEMLNKYYYQENADEFTMALAGVGLLASGVTYASSGSASPAKISISLLKVSKKLNKLPPSLEKSLTNLFRQVAKTGELKALNPVTDSIAKLSRTDGLKMRDFFTILSRSDSIEDLKLMDKVVSSYGNKAGKFLKLAGKSPLTVIKKFPADANMVKAMDTAIKYGADGTRLLEKVGPVKFLKYVTATKYTARGIRSIWQGRLSSLLVKIVSVFPPLVLWAATFLSGIITFGIPIYYFSNYFSTPTNRLT